MTPLKNTSRPSYIFVSYFLFQPSLLCGFPSPNPFRTWQPIWDSGVGQGSGTKYPSLGGAWIELGQTLTILSQQAALFFQTVSLQAACWWRWLSVVLGWEAQYPNQNFEKFNLNLRCAPNHHTLLRISSWDIFGHWKATNIDVPGFEGEKKQVISQQAIVWKTCQYFLC